MPEIAAATTPETPAPAPAAPAAAPPPEQVSQAARTLAQARTAAREALDKPAPEAAAETPPPKKDEPPTDEVLDLIREQRKTQARAKELDAREAALKERGTRLERWEKAETAAQGGDLIAAVQALGLDKAKLFDGEASLFWRLAALAKEAQEDKPDPAKEAERVALETIAKEKQKEQEAAAARAEQERAEARQRLEAGAKAINDAVGAEMNAHVKDYPAIARRGGIPDAHVSNPHYVGWSNVQRLFEVDAEGGVKGLSAQGQAYLDGWAAEAARARGGAKPSQSELDAHVRRISSAGFADRYYEIHRRDPTPAEVLQYFEAHYRKEIEEGAQALGLAAAPKPAPRMPTADWKRDVGRGAPPAQDPPKTRAEAIARAKAALEARRS
jgi:hypothetical protein